MIAKANEYRRLDVSKLSFAKETVSIEEALKDVAPVDFISKVDITKAEKDYDNKCVKLEISY